MTSCVLYALNLFPFNHYHEDIDFDAKHWFGHNVTFDAFIEKVFNQFELNYKNKINLPIDYVDPDLQFFNDYNVLHSPMNSAYFTEDTLKKIS